ncbi:hypothetical protein [Vannielia litorea]|uniref:Uncharacterized protein n=1 Tax=Vannielia litorea TaxID=1217970 RepID=A0A1N6FMA5_9RHOB|nr:hypothetical protein [Vannielia litorea]SIN96401.1 hypothetical protein SAMN05444002_1788 [Vannielia litorea]
MIRPAAAALLALSFPLSAQTPLQPVPVGLEALVVALVEQRADGEPSTFGPILRELILKTDDDPTNDNPGHVLTLGDRMRLTREAAILRVALTDDQIVQAWALKADLGRGCTGFPAALHAFWSVPATQEATPRQIATLSVLALDPATNGTTPEALAEAYRRALSDAGNALPARIVEILASQGPEPIPEPAGCAEKP